MNFVYILTSTKNTAETWRDEDNIITEQLGVFSSVKKAIEYAESTNSLFHILPNSGWWENEDGTIEGTTGGSWATVYRITKQQVK